MSCLRWLHWLLAISSSQANPNSFSVVSDIFEPWAIPQLQKAALNLKRFMELEGDKAIDFNWFPIGASPRNLLERAVAAIMESNIERGLVNANEVAGVSWWINLADDHDKLTLDHFHFDCDMIAQNLLNDSSVIMTPLMSTVTYFTDYGGPTAVFTDYDTERRLDENAVPSELLLSFPKAGKHIAFDSLRLHGTLSSVVSGGKAKGKKKRRKGASGDNFQKRMTLAVNFWDYQENVAKMPTRHYAQDVNFREKDTGQPIRSDTAKIGVPELQNLTRIVGEVAHDNNAWQTVALKSVVKAYVKPRVPNELGLQIPYDLLVGLSPGDDVALTIPPNRRTVLKYDDKAELQLGLPGVLLEAPDDMPKAERKRWSQFVKENKDKVTKSLSRRCTIPKYQELTMCKRNLTQTEEPGISGSDETCGASPGSCPTGTGASSEGKEQAGTETQPPSEEKEAGASKNKRKERRKKEGAGRRRRSEEEEEDEDEREEKERKYGQLLEKGIQAAEGGKQALARGYLQDAIELRPSIADQAQFALGVLDAQENKEQEALFRFQAAVKLNPRHADAKKNVEVLLARGVTPSE